MGGFNYSCTICGTQFEPQFRYQMEERVEHDEQGEPRARFLYFCSQRCLEKSHQQTSDGTVTCDACAASFRLELASQVFFSHGRRHYACGAECRAQLLAEAQGARLGDQLDARPAQVPNPAPALGARPAGATSPLTVPRAPVTASAAPVTASATLRPPEAKPSSAELAPPVAIHAANDAKEPPLQKAAPGEAPRVIAVFNHKGGTGKTTTAVTLAAGLAARGKRTLLVDTDGQGNVAVSLALTVERSLYHVLVMGLPVSDAVVHAGGNLHVLPANETLAAAELYLAGRRQRDRVLATRLAQARADYDYVVVDCSPSLSLMNQNALVMSDAVLCPVACDYLSLVGVRQVLRTIKSVNKHLNHPVRLWGVLPTLFDARARICHEALDTLRDHFKERCFEPVRLAIKVKEAPAQGKTLLDYAPGASATTDYLRVVDRLLAEQHSASVDTLEVGVAQ